MNIPFLMLVRSLSRITTQSPRGEGKGGGDINIVFIIAGEGEMLSAEEPFARPFRII